MACEICGRNSCTASFHSIEEQQNFDEVADKIKALLTEYNGKEEKTAIETTKSRESAKKAETSENHAEKRWK